MRAEVAWLALVGSIAAYELACRPEQLLTAGADRFRSRHPLAAAAVYAAVFTTAVHLAGYRGRWDVYRGLYLVRGAVRKGLFAAAVQRPLIVVAATAPVVTTCEPPAVSSPPPR